MTIGGIAEALFQEEKAFLAKPENGSWKKKKVRDTVDGQNPAPVDTRYVVYPTIYRVSYVTSLVVM